MDQRPEVGTPKNGLTRGWCRPLQLLNRAPRIRGTGNEWRVVGVTAVVKFVVMGLSGVLGILTSRMIISHYGVDSYAQYGLLSSLPSLLPFADLGVAAAIVNVVASSPHVSRDLEVRQTITSALRILAGSSATIVLVSIVLYLVGAWPAILGDGLTASARDGDAVPGRLRCLVAVGDRHAGAGRSTQEPGAAHGAGRDRSGDPRLRGSHDRPRHPRRRLRRPVPLPRCRGGLDRSAPVIASRAIRPQMRLAAEGRAPDVWSPGRACGSWTPPGPCSSR